MALRCSICSHPEATKINKMLVKKVPLRQIAERFGDISTSSLHRHKKNHLPRDIAVPIKRQKELEEAFTETLALKAEEETQQAITVLGELNRVFVRLNKLFNACDEWLTDPENPAKYTLEPRAEEVNVIYTEQAEDGKPRRKRQPLSQVLARLEGEGLQIEGWEARYADPRELILKTAGRLGDQIELLAKLIMIVEQEKRIEELEKIVNIKKK